MKILSQVKSSTKYLLTFLLLCSFIFLKAGCGGASSADPVVERLTIRLQAGQTVPKSETSGNVTSTVESFNYDLANDTLTIECSGTDSSSTAIISGHRIEVEGGFFEDLVTGTFTGLTISTGLRRTATFTDFLVANKADQADFKREGRFVYTCLALAVSGVVASTITYNVLYTTDNQGVDYPQ